MRQPRATGRAPGGFYNVQTYTNPVLTNTPPVAVNDTVTAAPGATSVPLAPLGNDTDANGDALVVTSVNGVALTPGVAQTITVPNGTVEVTAAGALSFVPTAGFVGSSTFPYSISDQRGGTASASITVTLGLAPVPVGGAGWIAVASLLAGLLVGWRRRSV